MITNNNGYALLSTARAALGLFTKPRLLLEPDIKSGRLIQLLPDWRLGQRQAFLLYYRDQHMTPRLRRFINYSINEFVKN